MAEANTNNKIGILAKAQKQLSRTKTKVLQNLGKAEKTTDDVFKDHVLKTERQQEVAQHLQKELKIYSHCVKDLSQACKNVQHALSETYEPEWKGESKFKSQLQAFELLWNDYLQKLQDNVINPMNAYLQSFPVLKAKVSKRGRKMVDYDNSRHNLEVLQAAKRRDDAKITKAQDELKDVKRIFDELNNELHTELPEFYDSRVTFYADLYSKFFDAEYTLHTEVGKTCDSIQEIAQSLGKDFEHYKYKPKRPTSVTDGSVNGETPITASPSLRSSTSSSQSPQKEPMYSNQDQGNMPQSAVKPKRKAPVAPAPILPYFPLEAEISCSSLDTVCSQPSNASMSSGSHHSIKAEILKYKKYFSRWKQRFQSKNSLKDLESSIKAKEEIALEVPATDPKFSPPVSKVEGVKSLCDDISIPKKSKIGENRKAMSLPDHLKEDPNSKPISAIEDVPAGSSLVAATAKALKEENCTVVQEEVKMKPVVSHITFCIPEDADDGAKSQQWISGDMEKKVNLASTESSGTGTSSKTSESDSDDDSYMKSMIENIKAADGKMSSSDSASSTGKLQSKLFSPSPALFTSREVANVEQDEALLEEAVKPNHFVPLDEVAKKHLALKKSHFKSNRQSSIKEMEPEIDTKVTLLDSVTQSCPVNLQLLPDVKRNESTIRWNEAKNSWVDREIYGSNKAEVCPLLSDDDDEQFTSCRDDFQSNALAPKPDILDAVEELETLQKKTKVKKYVPSKSKKAANDKKEFYKVAFLESSSSAEDEYETTKETMHPAKIVEETNVKDEDSKLFGKEKLNFLSQHLRKKHVIQADKALENSLETKDNLLIPSVDIIAGGSNTMTVNEKCECLGDVCVKNNCLEVEEDDEKTTVDVGSDSESCTGVSHKETRSASVDLPMKKLKSPAKKSPINVTVAMSDKPARIPIEVMPEAWQDDNMKNSYDIVTVLTEDLSTSPQVALDSTAKPNGHAAKIRSDIVTGIPMSEEHSRDETILGSAAVTVNVCLNNDTSPLLVGSLLEKGKDMLSAASSDSDSSTFTNQPKFRKPKSQDKLARESGSEELKNKLNRAGSLEESLMGTRKAAENVYYVKNNKGVKEDTDFGSLSNSSVSIVTANETFLKDDSDPSVSMASNKWNLRGLMSMLMPVTVQTLASHTKSYINSYLSSNKPSEKDAIEIQKIIAENLSKEDYYNLIGKSRDSSVDISINLDEMNDGLPEDTLKTAHEDLMSLSSIAKLGEATDLMSFSVDKPQTDRDVTPQISEHSFRDVTLTKSVPEAGAPEIEQQKVDSSDLDILEQHFQTVLLDIVSKGSTQLKKNKIASAKNPKSASTPMSSEHLENEHIKGISSHGSGLNSEGTDKENSYMLHDAMLSRLQMSLPLLSKSQGKADSGVISDDSSMDNACSWTFSKESLTSKSSADNDLHEAQPGPEDGKGRKKRDKKKSKGQSPPLDSTLHKSLATRRDALKCSGEDDECLVNEDSDQCTHASEASSDSIHSTIFLGPHFEMVIRSPWGKDYCTESANAKSSSISHKVLSPCAQSTISQRVHGASEINYDSNMSVAEESPPTNCRMGSREALVIEDKDMMDFKTLFSQSEGFGDNHAPACNADGVEASAMSVGPYGVQCGVTDGKTSDPKHATFKVCCAGEEKFVENESHHECGIGDTDCIHCLLGDDTRGVEDGELKDFGSGDDKDYEDVFNGWGHDGGRCECHDVIADEEVWMECTVGQQMCPELPFGTLELQPSWKDLCRVDLDEHVESLVDIHYRKQDGRTEACSNSAAQIDGSCAPELQGLDERLNKERKVRFSSFVEVCLETELDDVMLDDGVASLTVYRDILKDCDDTDDDDDGRDIERDVPDTTMRPDQVNDEDAWCSQDSCTVMPDKGWDNRGMYDLIHSEQFVNSQYARDESSFYRQRSVMHSRDKTKARRAQFFYSDVTADAPSECEIYSLPEWPLNELDILVHIQPVSLMPRDLNHGMSLLDEELLTITEDLEYSLQKSPALSLLLNQYGCLLSIDKPVSESFVEEFEDKKGFEKVEILNAFNRSHPEIMNTSHDLALSPKEEEDVLNTMCKADTESNLNSSSLNLGNSKSSIEGLGTSQCGDVDKVFKAEEILNEEIVDCKEVMLTKCQKLFSCNCKNVICLGCCSPSSYYVKEVGSIYVPEKFTMSLEDALKRYQETYHVHSSAIDKQIDSQESKDVTHESDMLSGSIKAEPLPIDENKRCEMSSALENDAGLHSAILGMGLESLETIDAPVEDQYYEDFIDKCPSTEVSFLIPQLTEIEADELKIDETEIGFLQCIDTRQEDHNPSQPSELGECRIWQNCQSFPVIDKSLQDCNELAEDSSCNGALIGLQGMCEPRKQTSLSLNEGQINNSDTCLFHLEHCQLDQSQLFRRNLTVAEIETVDMMSAESEEFFSVLSHPASLSLKHIASLENVCQNVPQVVDQDLSQSSKSASSAENYLLFMPASMDLSSEGCMEMPSELAALCTSLDSPMEELSSGRESTPIFPLASHMLYKQMPEDHQDSTEKIMGEFSSVGSSCLSHSVDDVTMDCFDEDTNTGY